MLETSPDTAAATVDPVAETPPPGARKADGRQWVRDLADIQAVEAIPLSERYRNPSVVDMLRVSAARYSENTAVRFQLTGAPNAPLFDKTYRELMSDVVKLANALHRAGVKPGDRVALLLPNLPETVAALYAAQAIGSVCPINPLLEPETIGEILQESGATALITLAPFPKTDLSAKAARAAADAPSVKLIVEIDLLGYLKGVKRLAAPLLRPKRIPTKARVVGYKSLMRNESDRRLIFERKLTPESEGALFHTGGSTGAPKLARHSLKGMVFHAWSIQNIILTEKSVTLCALPLFHVFAAYVGCMAAHACGAKLVLTTPQGFRGDGVIDNLWKLVERHRATFLMSVPTAFAALESREVDADISSLELVISGSAPLAQATLDRFEATTGATIIEGYGMTEATCVTACNPPDGVRKVGSVGPPMPYVTVRIASFDGEGRFLRDCATDEIGEICFNGPNVFPGYLSAEKTADALVELEGQTWLRTGDLGRVDADGYIWITGRAKDLIIRGGHNIDPRQLEEAMTQHPAVLEAGAIGQPDAYAGELPCVYVELKPGAEASAEELKSFAAEHVSERAARPSAVVVMPELPKTAVGKTFKPALRQEALGRVYRETLAAAGIEAEVEVEDDPTLGMVAIVRPVAAGAAKEAISEALSGHTRPWRLG